MEIKKSVMGAAVFSSRTSMEQGCERPKIKLYVVSIARWKSLGEKASRGDGKQTSTAEWGAGSSLCSWSVAAEDEVREMGWQ